MPEPDKIEIESITSPGKTQRVDRAKYSAMRTALLGVLPRTPPGVSVAVAKQSLLPTLPADLFPGGATAGWWLKAVQLDLEAKGVVARAAGRPVRLFKHRAAGRTTETS
ncbi:hypothetical protein B9Y66_19900 [Stenotrophomonas maltophilia]|nr:hypothetical protein B9Y66_19900 [Stenotrophomonas maltophilia]